MWAGPPLYPPLRGPPMVYEKIYLVFRSVRDTLTHRTRMSLARDEPEILSREYVAKLDDRTIFFFLCQTRNFMDRNIHVRDRWKQNSSEIIIEG